MIPLSPVIEAAAWMTGHILVGVIGVILGIFLEALLPNRVRVWLLYWGNRASKWRKNNHYRLEFISKYELDDPMEKEEFDEQLARSINVRSDDHGQFCFDRKSGSLNVDIVIKPHYDASVSNLGQTSINTDNVESVTIELTAEPEYRNLTSSLIDLQDIDRDIMSEIIRLGSVRKGSVVRCELPTKPTIQKILGKGEIETLTGKSADGDRITVSGNEIEIHSRPKSTITSTVKRAIVHYA